MKRIEFTIIQEDGVVLREPGFISDCSELPIAIMRAVEDLLEASGGEIHLPLAVHVRPSSESASC